MQTREENLNDLIESLEISSAYRQRQERFWKEQGIRDCMPLVKEDRFEKVAQFH
jgi:hypothetical protein